MNGGDGSLEETTPGDPEALSLGSPRLKDAIKDTETLPDAQMKETPPT